MIKIISYMPLCILLIVSCSFNHKEERTIIELQISSVDFDIETVIKVSCRSFNSYFHREIKNIVIKDDKKLKEFNEIIKTLKKDPEKYFPDVRSKILIKYNNNTVDTLCLSSLGLELNGVAMIYDQRIVRLISPYLN